MPLVNRPFSLPRIALEPSLAIAVLEVAAVARIKCGSKATLYPLTPMPISGAGTIQVPPQLVRGYIRDPIGDARRTSTVQCDQLTNAKIEQVIQETAAALKAVRQYVEFLAQPEF